MNTRTSRTLARISGAATLFALAALVPTTVRAQDTTSSSPTTTDPVADAQAAQDTAIPSQLQPLFEGITLTPDARRQVAAIWQRHQGMGAGVGDTLGGQADTTGGGHQEYSEALFEEIRGVIPSSDQETFDRNVKKFKKDHGEMKDSTYKNDRSSDSDWEQVPQDSSSTSQPPTSDPNPTSEPSSKP
jgi:hypothetical protein